MDKDAWVKSCESGGCVEVVAGKEHVAISATGSPYTVLVTHEEWQQFVVAVKAGKFD